MTKLTYASTLQWALFLFLSLSFFSAFPQKQPADYVDPFICTQGDHGQWLPAALVPYGLVEVCPDTYPGSLIGGTDYAHSGYDFSDNQVRGFSNFHKGSSGNSGIKDRAGLLSIIPFVNATDSLFKNAVIDIDKATEKATPGYYSVILTKEQIRAELTADTHVALHRYSFQEKTHPQLFIFEGNRKISGGLSVSLINSQTIEGKQECYAGIYFIMKFSHPVIASKVWTGKTLMDENKLEKQPAGGIVCSFGDLQGQPLVVKIGVSLTSVEAARQNLERECPSTVNFDQVKIKARNTWNEKLNLIQVEGNDEYKTIFYTALYHSCFMPQVISDVNGTYPGLDQKIHEAKGYKHYANYAFWDDFRTKYPLYSLFQPAEYRDMVKSLRDLYEQTDNYLPFPEAKHLPHTEKNFMPSGKDGYQAFNTCRHEHMLMTMTDAYYKGLFDLDLQNVYPYLRKEAMVQMPEKYDAIGYIPARPDQTGEYCWDNWCMAQLAKTLNKQSDYNYFMKRSTYWENTWDPSIRFFRARAADGKWLDFPDDPAENREKYTYEGSKWQWRWNVVHDVPALIAKLGGKEAFLNELSYFFDHDLYTAGNQIDLQTPYLFNLAGAPWLTQKWTVKILTEPIVQKYGTHKLFSKPIFDRIYKTTPDGYLLEMDDDYGCMAAWYALSAMGLYQICPGDPVYQLTSPIFNKITLHLDQKVYNGKEFTIEAKNLSKTNRYIQSASLNGKPLHSSQIAHSDVAKGGKLVFEMGAEPNKQWGIHSEN